MTKDGKFNLIGLFNSRSVVEAKLRLEMGRSGCCPGFWSL